MKSKIHEFPLMISMSKPYHVIVFLSVVFITSYSGCKKQTERLPVCLCTSFTTGSDTNAAPNLIEYGADNRMKRVVLNTPFIYEATYYPDSIVTDWYATYDSNYHSQIIYHLNAQGFVSKQVNISQTGQIDSSTYQYDAETQMTQKKVYASNGSYTRTYVWGGGNLVSYTTTGISTASAVYEHFTDKVYTGRPRIYFERYFGKLNFNPEKRVDVTGSNGVTTTTLYSYTFDGYNNITKETVVDSDGGSTVHTYQYECK